MRVRRLLPLSAALALPGLALAPSLLPGGASAGTGPAPLHGAQLAALGSPARSVPGPDGPNLFSATLPNGRRITPAGRSIQVGQNPLNSVLTPDGHFLVTSNSDERNTPPKVGTIIDPADRKRGSGAALSSYALSIVDTTTMTVVASVTPPKTNYPHPGSTSNGRVDSDASNGLFLGVAVQANPDGTPGYRVFASGGVADVVYVYSVGADGTIAAAPQQIPLPVPTDTTQATYGMAAPGWLTLSADKQTLYVVNNNGNSVTPVDLRTFTPGTPVPVGYFPYAALQVKDKLFVSNWGVTTRTFADGQGTVDPKTGVATHAFTTKIGGGTTNRFANPDTDPAKSSSLSVLDLASGLTAKTSVSLARPIDGINVVGGTHPSALAYAAKRGKQAVYVADANEDAIAVVDPTSEKLLRRVLLPVPTLPGAVQGGEGTGPTTFGLTPNALAVSPDQKTLYAAEAGLNSIAVYDLKDPTAPSFRGRIPTGWYPVGVTVSPDGSQLYVTNAKGAGAPYHYQGTYVSPGVYTNPDVNWFYGSVQKVDLSRINLPRSTAQVVKNTVVKKAADTAKLGVLQKNLKHVVFILRENKSYDTYFGDDAVLNGRGARGNPDYAQYGPYVRNAKSLAETFNVGDNNYADSEESNAGHSFALAGTSTDYQQKTLLSRFQRPLVNIKNEDPEDYPLQGYIYNAMARNGKSYRDYGDNIRISGYDDGSSNDFCSDDPKPGCSNATYNTIADTTSPTAGLGGTYSETLPALKVLGGHLDENYPGWNLRISDQRRAKEFISDYGSLVSKGTAPQFASVWLPGDHTGGCATPTTKCTPNQEVADNDVALGQIIDYLTHSPIWKDTAIFLTQDDAQSSPDHINAHRTYTTVISPYAVRGQVVHDFGSTVSVPKTIEEILDLPAMSYGDLLANDLLGYFTTKPDLTPWSPVATQAAAHVPAEVAKVWSLASKLPTGTYDTGTGQLQKLTSVYFQSLALSKHKAALSAPAYAKQQAALYAKAERIVS
ncbi:lactonase family protein with 7-bladed beta-propeller [Motilibacter rhizosphaerae]|uniref:Lactonase family protein with 7-bladed beta-propeller n=1 Tax=Motilibacter rhizosphaerae TaxID=598652 RepID=A0A4Q7NPA5_9ACTN|nr:alkaline phosphatase family protein [Motilibacter rhizosphaerae]RZS86912.1 lactonase family protein with 7-bladed beta-propeller [Motilibacter rhizosphaerae]